MSKSSDVHSKVTEEPKRGRLPRHARTSEHPEGPKLVMTYTDAHGTIWHREVVGPGATDLWRDMREELNTRGQ